PTVEQLESRCLLSTNVLTYHNDPLRTGANLTETTLTPDNVGKPGSFGKLFDYPVDGQVYAQPLYMPNVKLPNGSVHNIVFVATENDSVYAFDANGGGQLWYTHLLGMNQIPFQSNFQHDTQCEKGTTSLNIDVIKPQVGITSTPVIDFNSS